MAQGKFGDYNCDSSEELVKSATQFIKQYSEGLSNVPFILWTGWESLPSTFWAVHDILIRDPKFVWFAPLDDQMLKINLHWSLKFFMFYRIKKTFYFLKYRSQLIVSFLYKCSPLLSLILCPKNGRLSKNIKVNESLWCFVPGIV